MVGSIVSWAAALAFCAIGVGAIAAPRLSSLQYGLRTVDEYALGFVRALGARDLVLGLIIAALTALGDRRALSITLAICAVAGAADFLIVLARRRRLGEDDPLRSLGVHAFGTLALLAAAGLVAAGR